MFFVIIPGSCDNLCKDAFQAFFIDSTGALCHGSGFNVDIIDIYLVLCRRRPFMKRTNLWSHPFPRFSYENSQILITFHSDPAFPSRSCSEVFYPNESWRNSQFTLACGGETISHLHSFSDFQPANPHVPFTPLSHTDYTCSSISYSQGTLSVTVKPRSADEGTVTLWDIVPLSGNELGE